MMPLHLKNTVKFNPSDFALRRQTFKNVLINVFPGWACECRYWFDYRFVHQFGADQVF